MHLGPSNISIPVRNRSETSPSVQVHTRQPKSRWNQCACLPAIGPHCFAIFVDLCVEPTGSPAAEDLLQSRFIDAKKIGERLQVRSERNDRANI